MWKETIAIQGPYDFDRVLDRYSLDPMISVNKNERSILVPLWIDKMPYIIKVMAIGTIEKPSFIVEGTDRLIKDDALKKVEHIFQWNESLEKVYEHFQHTSLASLFEQHRGTPLILDFDYYSSLARCIIHQQLNLKFAQTLTYRFAQHFGRVMDGVTFFPLPEEVAEIKTEQLRELQFSQRKAEYVIGLSKLIADGTLNLETLSNQSDEEIIHDLVKIRGIGKWTAENFLLFALGRKNLFPMADIGIQRAIQKFFHMDRKPTYEEMEDMAKEWQPYLSYASLYLWRSIEVTT